MDFSQNLDKDYASLASKVQGKKVAVLVNNVGQSHSIPVPFTETELSEMTNIININCLGTLRATQTVLPSMLPQKKGLVLTMGSFGGLTPTPMLATYSGSKAFLQQWSNALASELEPNGISVHFVHSYLVTSSMSKIRRANWQVPTEKSFVRSALAKIGRRGGSIGYPYSGSPYWSHALVAALITGILGPMSNILLGINRKMHIDIRRRALKKAEKLEQRGKKIT
jgi:17beta-estradiol 17-dehydrogenase / very-long-chain 3-oxoacyl-CoA reductase